MQLLMLSCPFGKDCSHSMMSSLSRIVTSRSAGWGSVRRLIFFQSKITGMSVVSISRSGIRLSSSSSFHCSSVSPASLFFIQISFVGYCFGSSLGLFIQEFAEHPLRRCLSFFRIHPLRVLPSLLGQQHNRDFNASSGVLYRNTKLSKPPTPSSLISAGLVVNV